MSSTIYFPNRRKRLDDLRAEAKCDSYAELRSGVESKHQRVLGKASTEELSDYLSKVCGRCPVKVDCLTLVVLDGALPTEHRDKIAGGLVGLLNTTRADSDIINISAELSLKDGINRIRREFYETSNLPGHSTQGVPTQRDTVTEGRKEVSRHRVITDEVYQEVRRLSADYLEGVGSGTSTI